MEKKKEVFLKKSINILFITVLVVNLLALSFSYQKFGVKTLKNGDQQNTFVLFNFPWANIKLKRFEKIAKKMGVRFDPKNFSVESAGSLPFKINGKEIPKKFLTKKEQVLYGEFRAKTTRAFLSLL